ncbi:MAG: MBL fold metallo-hydrolase [Vicinamibacterales bacterium]
MVRRLLCSVVATLALSACGPRDPLDRAAKTLGVDAAPVLRLTASGTSFALGQNATPAAPWPRFAVKRYEAVIDFASDAMRVDMVRTQAEQPPHGGGGQPLAGEQTSVQLVSGNVAWNVTGDTASPAPAAVAERRQQIWLTPQGFVRAARAAHAAVSPATRAGKSIGVVAFTHDGAKVTGIIDDEGRVTEIETQRGNAVLGDMPVRVTFEGYKAFGDVVYPTHVQQIEGSHPVFDLDITSVHATPSADLAVPDAVKAARPVDVVVETEQLERGVWYLKGGSHHSVLVEFGDHLVLVEAPLNEARSVAVMAEAKRLSAKPITLVVNTHHHFDHAGGLRTYVAAGIPILTHEMNAAFYAKAWAFGRMLEPDALSKSPVAPSVETMTTRRDLSDGKRTLEVHLVSGNLHHEGLLMAYLPKERILIEADAFNPPPPNTPPPSAPNPFTVNLVENVQRLGLRVNRIAPIHGRVVLLEDALLAAGRTSAR